MTKAAALKVELSESELDTAFAEAQKNIPADTLQQELTRREYQTAADMREGLRRELLTQKVINQEVGSKIAVTDQDVSDFYNANRAQFNVPEEAYRLAQIVVTPARDGQLTNRTGDDATTPQAAVEKVKMLMERLKAGASFSRIWPSGTQKIPSRLREAATWVSCRCRSSNRRHRHCATRCSTKSPVPSTWQTRAGRSRCCWWSRTSRRASVSCRCLECKRESRSNCAGVRNNCSAPPISRLCEVMPRSSTTWRVGWSSRKAPPCLPLRSRHQSRSSARQRSAMDKRNAAISWSLRTSRTSPTSTG